MKRALHIQYSGNPGIPDSDLNDPASDNVGSDTPFPSTKRFRSTLARIQG